MRDQRIVRSVNYPRELYKTLQDEQKKFDLTNREQVRLAVQEHLDDVRDLLTQAGFSKYEDERKLVRLSVDPSIDSLVDETADLLGVDYSTILLACLRCKYGLRVGDPGAEKLKRRIARRDK